MNTVFEFLHSELASLRDERSRASGTESAAVIVVLVYRRARLRPSATRETGRAQATPSYGNAQATPSDESAQGRSGGPRVDFEIGTVEMRIENAALAGRVPPLPQVIASGSLQMEHLRYSGSVPLPLQHQGKITLELTFQNGQGDLYLTGDGIRAVVV